jgi:hypothetical protein
MRACFFCAGCPLGASATSGGPAKPWVCRCRRASPEAFGCAPALAASSRTSYQCPRTKCDLQPTRRIPTEHRMSGRSGAPLTSCSQPAAGPPNYKPASELRSTDRAWIPDGPGPVDTMTSRERERACVTRSALSSYSRVSVGSGQAEADTVVGPRDEVSQLRDATQRRHPGPCALPITQG